MKGVMWKWKGGQLIRIKKDENEIGVNKQIVRPLPMLKLIFETHCLTLGFFKLCYEIIYYYLEEHWPIYLHDTWLKNEMGVLNTTTKYRKKLPVSVEQAKAQI
jgi:hypothetical protein